MAPFAPVFGRRAPNEVGGDVGITPYNALTGVEVGALGLLFMTAVAAALFFAAGAGAHLERQGRFRL